MSIRLTASVWEHSKHSGHTLLMLLALADYADDDGRGIWPSYETLARKCRVSRRQAISTVQALVASGVVTVEGRSMAGSNQYRIAVERIGDELVKPASPVLVKSTSPSASPDGEAHFTRLVKSTSPDMVKSTSPVLVKSTSPNPSLEPSLEPSLNREGESAREIVIPEHEKNRPSPPRQRKSSGKKSDPDPLRSNPAVQVYRETFGALPGYKAALEAIAEITDIPKWSAVCDEWLLRGYKPGNIAGLLDVYRNGWRDSRKPAQQQSQQRAGGRPARRAQVPDATEAEREAARAAARERIAKRAAERAKRAEVSQ